MIRFAGATITLTLAVLIGSLAFAQDSTPKVQVFGGYSLLHEDLGGLTDLKVDLALHDPSSQFGVRSNFNGWNAEGQYNAGRWLGFAVDAGGYSGVPFTASRGTSGLPDQSRYSLLVGPVLSYRTKSRFTPYIHTLFGWERAHLSASTLSGSSSASPVATTSVATSYTDFTMALGGGLDYTISRRFALRVGQVDWYRTYLNLSKFYGNAYNSSEFDGLSTRQKNIRVSAGIVVQF